MNPEFLKRAINIAREKSADGINGPFGAVVVKNNQIVGEGWNRVIELADPTAHAEIVAIREACGQLKTHVLSGCTIYCSCEPCPMCLASIMWSRIDKVVFSCSQEDAAYAGFDDGVIRTEIMRDWEQRTIDWEQSDHAYGFQVLENWVNNPNKLSY